MSEENIKITKVTVICQKIQNENLQFLLLLTKSFQNFVTNLYKNTLFLWPKTNCYHRLTRIK